MIDAVPGGGVNLPGGAGRAGAMGLGRAAAILVLCAPALGAGDDPRTDAAVVKRLEGVRARASRIKVDGKGKDWDGIPSFEDKDPPGFTDASLDIRRAAIAPLEDELLVLIETAATPSRSPLAFGLDIDFLGRSGRDASLQFGANEALEVTVFPEGEAAHPGFPRKRVEVSFGAVVEIRIPLDSLAARIGGAAEKEWNAGARRPFVRVQTWSAMKGIEGPVDTGPAPASFRLTTTPFLLDPPLREDGEPRRAVGLPLEGTWFVRQGDHGLWSHADLWAYDLAVEDHSLSPTAYAGSRTLDDYLSYGRKVIAPEGGTVVFDSAKSPDREPLSPGSGKDLGNTLVVRMADGLRLSFGHLQADSPAFARGASFAAGAVLARVGNSGDSSAPHLHLSLHERPGEFTGLPLAFSSVRVGLNPGPDDPWARDLPSWAVREGWFVAPR